MARDRVIILAMILASLASSAFADGEKYTVFSPHPVDSPRIPDNPSDGILVETVTVNRGDTLKKLSKKYSGRSAFFSQILLFNKIVNPDLIYPGDSLRVPVTKPAALSGPGSSQAVVRRTGTKRTKPSVRGHIKHHDRQKTASRMDEATGQLLFNRGVTAYNKGSYRRAVELFDKFLKNHPGSPSAADAAFYRADSLMELASRPAR